MEVMDAIKAMIGLSGKSGRSISADIGRSSNYISVITAKNADIGAAKVAEIARVCGYELVLRGPDDSVIPIDAQTKKDPQ